MSDCEIATLVLIRIILSCFGVALSYIHAGASVDTESWCVQ